MISYVTGAATASEMKAVTTARTAIRMSDRPVVTFLAAACTGHYPGVRTRPLSAFIGRITGNTPVRNCRFWLSRACAVHDASRGPSALRTKGAFRLRGPGSPLIVR
jgi:hypothetical protein